MQLRAVVYEEDYSVVLRLLGPLTRDSVPDLEEPLMEVLQPAGRHLILDLGEVSECDSAGAAALFGIWQMSRQRAGETSFACPAPAVRAWLHLLVFQEIPVYGTIDGADRADPGQRIDPVPPITPQPRREYRAGRTSPSRPGNAAHAVYARPSGGSAKRNRPRG
ncbi:MAG TPA: STAS domain-containing protein [Micromonosporaceae bacterium]|nr:STAS domain-containing protein [Micromonosporaceae bacterium]